MKKYRLTSSNVCKDLISKHPDFKVFWRSGFAFKDCDNIEIIMLPSTLKLIKLNAFYRATNLKKVICACRIEDFVNEGFYGESGEVNPQWFFIK